MGCVYIATNSVNGKHYVGKTKHSLEYRKSQHLKKSRAMIINGLFQRALAKYGAGVFVWRVLFESNDHNVLSSVEIQEIASHQSREPNGYNLTDGGDGAPNLGVESRLKMRMAKLGKKRSPDVTARIVAAITGRVVAPEVGRHISEAKKGKNFTPEHRAALRKPKAKPASRFRTINFIVEWRDKRQCLTAWAEETNIPPRTLWNRIRLRGWSIERALTQPVRNQKVFYHKDLRKWIKYHDQKFIVRRRIQCV